MHCHNCASEGEETQKRDSREGNSPCVSIGETISLLANQQRRDLLLYLNSAQQPVALSEVVDHLSTHGDTEYDGGVGEDTREKVHISLRHNHLPRLEKVGIIEFDAETEMLTYNSEPTLEAFLEVCEELQD